MTQNDIICLHEQQGVSSITEPGCGWLWRQRKGNGERKTPCTILRPPNPEKSRSWRMSDIPLKKIFLPCIDGGFAAIFQIRSVRWPGNDSWWDEPITPVYCDCLCFIDRAVRSSASKAPAQITTSNNRAMSRNPGAFVWFVLQCSQAIRHSGRHWGWKYRKYDCNISPVWQIFLVEQSYNNGYESTPRSRKLPRSILRWGKQNEPQWERDWYSKRWTNHHLPHTRRRNWIIWIWHLHWTITDFFLFFLSLQRDI